MATEGVAMKDERKKKEDEVRKMSEREILPSEPIDGNVGRVEDVLQGYIQWQAKKHARSTDVSVNAYLEELNLEKNSAAVGAIRLAAEEIPDNAEFGSYVRMILALQ